MNRTDRYVNEAFLVDAISQTLLQTWRNRVNQQLVRDIQSEVQHLNEDLRIRVSGISVVGPTRGKMGALSEAVVRFVDETLSWTSKFVKGGAPDISHIKGSQKGRQIWVALPLSSCAMARVWSVCLATSGADDDPAQLAADIRVQVILPEALNETYLTSQVFDGQLRSANLGMQVLPEVRDAPTGPGETGDESLSYFVRGYGELGNEVLRAILLGAQELAETADGQRFP